jgi:hypothetical protein
MDDNARVRTSVRPTRPDASPKCAVDRPNDPLKSPRLFLIKNIRSSLLSAHCSYLLVIPICSPAPRGRLWAVALGCRPCLPDTTLGHRTAGPAYQARCAAASKPRLPSASLPCHVVDASLPPRAAAAASPPPTSIAGPLPPTNSTHWWAFILPSSKKMLQCDENACCDNMFHVFLVFHRYVTIVFI